MSRKRFFSGLQIYEVFFVDYVGFVYYLLKLDLRPKSVDQGSYAARLLLSGIAKSAWLTRFFQRHFHHLKKSH